MFNMMDHGGVKTNKMIVDYSKLISYAGPTNPMHSAFQIDNRGIYRFDTRDGSYTVIKTAWSNWETNNQFGVTKYNAQGVQLSEVVISYTGNGQAPTLLKRLKHFYVIAGSNTFKYSYTGVLLGSYLNSSGLYPGVSNIHEPSMTSIVHSTRYVYVYKNGTMVFNPSSTFSIGTTNNLTLGVFTIDKNAFLVSAMDKVAILRRHTDGTWSMVEAATGSATVLIPMIHNILEDSLMGGI